MRTNLVNVKYLLESSRYPRLECPDTSSRGKEERSAAGRRCSPAAAATSGHTRGWTAGCSGRWTSTSQRPPRSSSSSPRSRFPEA